MENEGRFGTLKAIWTLFVLFPAVPYWIIVPIFDIPYWLLKTFFSNDLDWGTRLSFPVLSIPSALLLF